MHGPLTEEQFARIEEDVKEVLQKHFDDQITLENELKSKYERLRVDSEQRYFELEKQQLSDHIRLEAETKAASDLRSQVTDLEKKYGEVTEKYRDLNTRYFEKSEHWSEQEQNLSTIKSRLEVEKCELSDLLDKRNREVDRLTDEWKQLSDRLNETTKLRITAENEAGEAKSQLVILQHRETRLKQELESIKLQSEWQINELNERTTELMTCKREKTVKVLELQSQLDDSIQEVVQCKQNLETAKNINNDLTQQTEEYVQKLKELRDMNTQLEDDYRQELLSQEKLLEIYKKSTTDSQQKIEEMKKAVEELQKLLKQANDVYEELQSGRDCDNQINQQLIAERDLKIDSLEKELKNANDLLEESRCHERQLTSQDDAEIVSSAAATVSRLIKSGMTLTQIYSEYVKVCSALQTEKDENKRLSDYLDQILHEIEEKAPLMKRQRHDYEKAVETVNQLTCQLDSAMMECERCRISSDNDHRRCGELTRENQRFKQQAFDLGRQVRLLLKELEESRGRVVKMTYDTDGSPAVGSSSSILITDKLVTFRSIEELQDQNQKLLAVVRELSDAQEERENESGDTKVAELTQQLEMALAEIKEMKESRQRQADLVESIVQQRDMYRILATQPAASPKVTPIMSTPIVSTPSIITASPAGGLSSEQQLKAFEENKAALKDLQEEMSIYRRERAENERMLNEQLDKTMKEASELRLNNARLASQLDFTRERLKIVQSNSESHHKEIEMLKDRNNKLTTSIAKHQQSVTMLQKDLMSAQEKLTRSEVRCQNLEKEKAVLKNVETRLQNEIESLLRNQQSRDELVFRLESIQNNFERSEFETRTRLTQQIDKLERENTVLRKKADGTDEQQKAFVVTLERQLSEARLELDRHRDQSLRLGEQLKTANEHLEFLKTELSEAQAKMQSADSKLASILESQQAGSGDRVQYELTRYRDLLADTKRDVESLQSKLKQSESNAEQYKAIADNVERSLHEHTETSERFKQDLELRIQQFMQDKQALEEHISELEAEIDRLNNENVALVNDRDELMQQRDQLADDNKKADTLLSEELAILRQQLEVTTQQLEQSTSNEAAARADSEQQAVETRLVQENYEFELSSHAADVEALNNMKQDLESITEQLEKATADAREAQSTLQSSQASWVEVEHGLKSEIDKLTGKLTDLEAQNTSLHQQLEMMSTQMVQMQSNENSDRQMMEQVADSIDDTSSVEQLLEVVRYLRKEKELVEARYELLQTETTRLRQQTTSLKKQTEIAQKTLAEEQENSQVSLQTAAQHADLMRKVESLNLLQDTNKHLTEENCRLTIQLQEFTNKSNKLESELGPLQDTCHHVSTERDSLQKEVDILQVEVERWKARTNHLIEQCNKFDPEEHKKAIAERDKAVRDVNAATEEMHKQRAEISRIGSLLQTAHDELSALKTEKEAEIEDRNKTITQLRKIGRKYRMQAEEVQKELDELKNKTAADHETSQSDSDRLIALEQERDDITVKLGSADFEKNEAVKKAVELQQRESKLLEQLAKLDEENSHKAAELASLTTEQQRLLAQQRTDAEDRTRLETENSNLTEEKKKLIATLQTAKQRLVALRSEKEKSELTCTELRKQIGNTGSLTAHNATVDADKAEEMKSEIVRLQSELEELQQARTALQLENQQHVEAVERLRRENADYQQKIQLLQCQRDLTSPAKPTVSAPPVERAIPVGASAELQGQPRKANIRPMASQQLHVRSVQPVRSSANETRAMASIRPMAASMMSSSSNVSTQIATVMPTTAAMSESEGTLVLASGTPQSQSQQQPLQQQSSSGRPTQQVQPVSSQHVEEATVSSSEEQQQDQWWPFEIPSTSSSSEHGTANSGLPGVGKRPRDDAHTQEDGANELDNEVPTKRSKQSAAEMADTTETSNTAMLPASAESEREAASVAQVDAAAEPIIEMKRETEPVTTSLSMGEHSRGAHDNTQEDYMRTGEHSNANMQGASSDDLPDYQEQSEQATLDYDLPRPSTSHAHSGTPQSDEVQDDNEDQAGGDEYQIGDDGGDTEQGNEEDDDIILVDDDDIVGGADDGSRGANEDYQESSGDEAEHTEDTGDYYQAEDVEYEIGAEVEHGDIPDEGEEGYEGDGDDKDIEQVDDEVDNDVIIVDDGQERDDSRQGSRQRQATEEGMLDTSDHSSTATVTTSVQPQTHATLRHMVMPVVTMATAAQPSAVAIVPSSTSSSVRVATSALPTVVRQQYPLAQQLSNISRSQLMPFIFGTESAYSTGEIGDDSIVPSTPTLQLPQRTDGFAEAVCSPQVIDEGFLFSSSEMVPHSGLAHQEGAGVDDTRMDLSQFDESGRCVPQSQQSHDSPAALMESAESSDVEQQLDPSSLVSETSVASESQSTSPGDHQSEDQTRASAQEEQPSTSQIDRTSSQDLSQSQGKPKIQRIVWEPEPRGSVLTPSQASSAVSGSVQGTVTPLISADLLHARRGAMSRGQPGYPRGPMRGSPRVSPQQATMSMASMHRPPGAVQPLRHPQVARRARGRGGPPTRGGYY